MTAGCPNCVALRDRVRKLELELGVRWREGAVGALVENLRLTPTEARVLLSLFEAKGRVMNWDRIADASGAGGTAMVPVMVMRVRKKLGNDSIHNVRRMGYRIGEPGVAIVLKTIATVMERAEALA